MAGDKEFGNNVDMLDFNNHVDYTCQNSVKWRARRKEYWYFSLFYISSMVLGGIDAVMGGSSAQAGIGLLEGIYTLALLIPSIAVSVRRLHDTDRSGWWLLIALIPIIGTIVLLVFMVQDSKPGENQYGMNPKEVTA